MTRQAIGAGRRARDLARIVDAVHVRRGSAGGGAGAHARAAGARADPARQRPDRMARGDGRSAGQVLQLGVSRRARRHAPPACTGRCTWCRSASTCRSSELLFFAAPLVEAVSELLGRHASRRCCRSTATRSARRSATRSSIRIWSGSSSTGGSELLTTITNDAWFGPTSAPYQHFAQASMRAIENGRYLVRSANTGISGIVDPYGRVLAQTGIFEPAVVVGEARFLQRADDLHAVGDVFAYASVVVTRDAAAGASASMALAVERVPDNRAVPMATVDDLTNDATRISASALPICGAIFEAARPDEELTRLEARAAAPDFWKDQAEAQKVLQRRRRLEQDRELVASLRKKSDDLAVLVEWAEAGEAVDAEFAPGARRRSIRKSRPARSRRCSAASTIARTRSSPSIPAPAAPSRRTGRRCCCACTCAGRSAAASSAR